RWRPQIVSGKARAAASWRATTQARNAAGRDLRPNPKGQALFCGNPALQHACAEPLHGAYYASSCRKTALGANSYDTATGPSGAIAAYRTRDDS
ncbi:hypothetical protein, partial [Salinisphaera orenii]|uniref:hypothetical protein n=1 Tax=Salinisphaera orenii TaxID=856731 RepID=UPI001C83A915